MSRLDGEHYQQMTFRAHFYVWMALKHLILALEEFQHLGIDFVTHQERIDLGSPAGRLMFQIIGARAQFERAIIRERVIAGLRQAKKGGKKLRRPPV